MPEITTLQYLRQIDHALDGMHTGEVNRSAEIHNIQASIRLAIREFDEGVSDADIFAKEMIELVRDRIDTLAANPNFAGNHEQFKTILPPPEEKIPDTERDPNQTPK